MSRSNFKIMVPAFLMLGFFILLYSCEKNDVSSENEVDQLFSPALFAADVNSNSVKFSWIPIKGASYTLEISNDSLLFSNNLQVFHLEEVKTFTIEDLIKDSRYSARIKAVSKNTSIKDSKFISITFVTGS